MTYEFTSHFDTKSNICYILVHGGGTYLGHASVNYLVFDAYEGRVYASYDWFNNQDKKYWEVTPIECNVKPRNTDAINCKTDDEFESLIDKYFSIGR